MVCYFQNDQDTEMNHPFLAHAKPPPQHEWHWSEFRYMLKHAYSFANIVLPISLKCFILYLQDF